MNLAEFVSMLRRNWLLVVVPFVVVCTVVGLWSMATTPIFTARASTYFSLPYGTSANDLYQGSNYTQQQLGSYADLATQPIVLDEVIDELDLGVTSVELARSVEAAVANESVIVDVSASSSSPDQAAAIANAVSERLGEVVQDLAPRVGDDGATIDAVMVATAVPPRFQSSPNTRLNVLAAGLASLLLGVLAAIARDRLDTRIRTRDDLPRDLGLLATVVRSPAARQNPVLATDEVTVTDYLRGEAFRRLRTNLRFIDVDAPPRVIVVSSAVSAEGKTSTSVNLARGLAADGRRVVLIEGDLRRPRVASYLGIESAVGLTDVLAGTVPLSSALRRWQLDELRVLPSGSLPPNPSGLLGSQAMNDLIRTLRADVDFVIIDSPPLLPVIDAAVVAAIADGAVLVVRHGRTTRQQLERAAESLDTVGARLLGAVINRAPRPRLWERTSSYYYRDDVDPSSEATPVPEPDSAPVPMSTSSSESTATTDSTSGSASASKSDPAPESAGASTSAPTPRPASASKVDRAPEATGDKDPSGRTAAGAGAGRGSDPHDRPTSTRPTPVRSTRPDGRAGAPGPKQRWRAPGRKPS